MNIEDFETPDDGMQKVFKVTGRLINPDFTEVVLGSTEELIQFLTDELNQATEDLGDLLKIYPPGELFTVSVEKISQFELSQISDYE